MPDHTNPPHRALVAIRFFTRGSALGAIPNDFPFRDFVLVATSNARETFKHDDRKKFIRRALEIAKGRQIIFKLHPAERYERAIREIRSVAPDAMILTDGNTEHMIANCSVLVAQYSTVAFTAAALGKEVHSYIDPEMLRRILPIQNGGTSSKRIREVCRRLLEFGRLGQEEFDPIEAGIDIIPI